MRVRVSGWMREVCEKTVALYKCASVLLLIRSQDGVNCIVIQLRVCAVFFVVLVIPIRAEKEAFSDTTLKKDVWHCVFC